MMLLVICAAVLATVFAQREPLCCSVEQYETNLRILTAEFNRTSGVATRELGFANLTYDKPNQRTYYSYVGRSIGGVRRRVSELRFFGRNIGYEIEDGVCTSYQISFPMTPNCVPADADARPPTYLGQFGDHLSARSYVFNVAGARVALLTNQDCFPLGFRSSGSRNNVDQLQDTSFFGATAGIRDPSVFAVPAICHQ